MMPLRLYVQCLAINISSVHEKDTWLSGSHSSPPHVISAAVRNLNPVGLAPHYRKWQSHYSLLTTARSSLEQHRQTETEKPSKSLLLNLMAAHSVYNIPALQSSKTPQKTQFYWRYISHTAYIISRRLIKEIGHEWQSKPGPERSRSITLYN